MKRAIICAFLMGMIACSYAQPAAGKIFVGGNLSFSTYASKDKDGGTTEVNTKTTNYGVRPFAGYFLNDKIAIGLGLEMEGYMQKYPGAVTSKSSQFGFEFNPFARYYLFGTNMGVFIEADLTAGFGTNKMTVGDLSTSRNFNSFGATVKPGLYYYMSPKLALEASIGSIGYSYSSSETGSDSKDINSGFNLSLYSGLTLGLTFTLN